MPASLSYRAGVSHRRIRCGTRLYLPPRGRVARDRQRNRAALSRAGREGSEVMRLKNFFAATLSCACLWSGAAALAADKITAGAIGAASGTLWPYYAGLNQGFFKAEGVD